MNFNSPEEVVGHVKALGERAAAAMDALDGGRITDALREFEEVLEEAPYIRLAGLGKGLALFKLGKMSEAIVFLSEFTVKFPDYAAAAQLRQRLLCGSDDRRPLFQKAVEYVRRDPAHGEIKNVSCGVNHKSDVEIAVVPSVSLLGEHGLLVAEGEIKFWESTIWGNIDAIFVPILNRQTRPTPVLRKGEYLPLYGHWSAGFYHWVMEWLPKAMMAEACGFTGTYVIQKGIPLHAESLGLLGVTPSRIIEFDGADWIAEKLWITPSTPGAAMNQFSGVFELLRELLLAGTGASKDSGKPSRIYLSRRNLERPRRVLNEGALISMITPYGFEAVDTESMPFKEQVKLFANAEAVIGASGAGLIHTLFMRPKSTILELFGPGYVNPVAYRTAELLKHRYFMIPSYQNQEIHQSADAGNFDAFLEIIGITLKNEFGG